MSRWGCKVCGWIGPREALLEAPNPFDPAQKITGCPDCKDVEQFDRMCDAEHCASPSSIGAPWKDGVYRFTCHEHREPTAPGSQ